jgi:hypothetical protein
MTTEDLNRKERSNIESAREHVMRMDIRPDQSNTPPSGQKEMKEGKRNIKIENY